MPLEEVEVRAPRLKVPEAFGDLFTDEKYERVSRALGKAYRDVVRGFRGEFEHPPDLVALPRDCSEVETVLAGPRPRAPRWSRSAVGPASSAGWRRGSATGPW